MTCVDQLTPQQLVSIACSFAKLRYCNSELLQRLVAASSSQMRQPDGGGYAPHQASGLLWAFGRLHRDFGFRVDAEWIGALLQQLQSSLEGAPGSSSGGRGRDNDDSGVRESSCDDGGRGGEGGGGGSGEGGSDPAAPRGAGSGECSASVLVQALYSCALLRRDPGPALLHSLLLPRLRLRAPELAPSELSTLLWSLATLGADPGREWVAAALRRTEAQVARLPNGTALASLLWSLAVMRHAPEPAWMEHFLLQVGPRV
jgi:hypothetical protein